MLKRLLTVVLTMLLVFSMAGYVQADTKDDDPYNSRTKYGEHELWVENIFATESYSGISVTVVLNLSELTDDECQTFIEKFQAEYGFIMPFLLAFPENGDDPEFECVDSKFTPLANNSGNAFVITYECNSNYKSLDGSDAAFSLVFLDQKEEDGSTAELEAFFKIDLSSKETDEDAIAYYEDAQGRSQVKLWHTKYYVDDFGRETDDPYIQNTDYDIGTFSNSVTTGSKLSAIFFADEDSVGIRLVEYGDYIVKNPYSKSVEYNVSMLDTEENRVDGLTGTMFSGGDIVYFTGKDKQLIINALEKPGEVAFLLVEADHRTNKYILTINTEGFAELYNEVFPDSVID